jgi:hypothetical protein
MSAFFKKSDAAPTEAALLWHTPSLPTRGFSAGVLFSRQGYTGKIDEDH